MTPDERDNFLTNRPPEIRGRILAKVAEYEALNPVSYTHLTLPTILRV